MENYLDRRDAALHLTNAGISMSKSTLARMAMKAEGPKYVIIRHKAYYKPEWLEEWLNKYLPSSSALEHMARKGGKDV